VFDLQAHLDDSWDDDVLCLTAAVAPLAKWGEIDGQWRAILEAPLPDKPCLLEFKAADCHHRTGVFRAPEWRQSSERLSVRDRLLDEVVVQHGLVSLGVAIDVDAFKTLQSERRILRQGYNHPHYLAFGALLQVLFIMQAGINIHPHFPAEPPEDALAGVRLVHALAQEHGSDFKIGLVVDRNEQRAHQVLEIFNFFKQEYPHLPLAELAFGDSVEHPGIQAADLMGYEVRRHFAEAVLGRRHSRSDTLRWPLGLDRVGRVRPDALHVVYFDAARLRRTADSFEEQRRGDFSSLIRDALEATSSGWQGH
jgi:hypothetical protein